MNNAPGTLPNIHFKYHELSLAFQLMFQEN